MTAAAELTPKNIAVNFAMSQAEDFGGEIDTAMDFDEFIEALLRLAVTAWREDPSLRELWQKMQKVAVLVAGQLEGARVKLSFDRREELIAAEEEKVNKIRVQLMFLQFSAESEQVDMKDLKKKCTSDPEAQFKEALRKLEKEGDEEVAAHARPSPTRTPSSLSSSLILSSS